MIVAMVVASALAQVGVIRAHAPAPPVREAAEWSLPAGYEFEAPAPCREAGATAMKAERPRDARYEICADQMTIFMRGLEEARRSDKLLLVTFGATWCPWCATLQRQLPNDDLLGRGSGETDLGKRFHHIEIGTSATVRGVRHAIPSGERVLDLIRSRAAGVEVRAIPFVAVVDPRTAARVGARNIDDLALTGRGAFDAPRLAATLRQLHDYVRGEAPEAAEPGWLKRKWLRWWHG